LIKLFVDTNVLIDVMAVREPFYIPAAALWASIEKGQRTACISATSVTTVAYLLRRHADHRAMLAGLDILIRVFEVARVDQTTIRRALDRNPLDYEDAVQMECAAEAGASHIVTRDPSGFVGSGLSVVSPTEALLLPLN
jgi:predicted nucleic acid-binding protein